MDSIHLEELTISSSSSTRLCYISALPSELLEQIFQWLYIAYCAAIGERGHPYLLHEICVCSLWKNVIEGRSLFWEMIVPSPENARLRQRALHNSRNGSLTFIITSNGTGPRDSTALLQDILQPGVLARTTCFRLEHLVQSIDFRAGDNRMLTIYPLIVQLLTGAEEVRALRELRVAIKLDFGRVPGRPFPNLRYLHLESVRRPPDFSGWARALQKLVLVKVADLDTSAFLLALETMVALESLEIVLTPLGMTVGSAYRGKHWLLLPNLGCLTLVTHISDMNDLLHFLAIPVVTRLTLRAYIMHESLPQVWPAFPAGETPVDNIVEAVAAVIHRQPCHHVDLGHHLRFGRTVVRDGFDHSLEETVVQLGVGNGLPYSFMCRVLFGLCGYAHLMVSVTSMALNMLPTFGGSHADWFDALTGLEHVRSLEIAGSLAGSQLVLSVLSASSSLDRALPLLERVAFFPLDFDMDLTDTIVSFLHQRTGSESSLPSVGVVKEFIVVMNRSDMARMHAEEFRVLSDVSLPIVVRFRLRRGDLDDQVALDDRREDGVVDDAGGADGDEM